MKKYSRLKILFICLMFLSSLLSACGTSQRDLISSESNDPSASGSIENNTSDKGKKIMDSDDPFYRETGGLYTEEDFENAIPQELPTQKGKPLQDSSLKKDSAKVQQDEPSKSPTQTNKSN